MERNRVSRRRHSVGREMEWRCHWGQETGHYLCMQSAGRSTPGSPDKSCSQIPALHNRGHTGSEPHGRHHMTYQASSHWWVPLVLGRYLWGGIEIFHIVMLLIYISTCMSDPGHWWFFFTVDSSWSLLPRVAVQQVYFLLEVAKALQVRCFMGWQKLLDLFKRALDFLSTRAFLGGNKNRRG